MIEPEHVRCGFRGSVLWKRESWRQVVALRASGALAAGTSRQQFHLLSFLSLSLSIPLSQRTEMGNRVTYMCLAKPDVSTN